MHDITRMFTIITATIALTLGCARGGMLPGGEGGAGGAYAAPSIEPTAIAIGYTAAPLPIASATATTTSTTTATATSTNTTTTTSTTTACGLLQHVCGGACVDNDPSTGCASSATCEPCPTPQNGKATCTASGACGIECAQGYSPDATSTTCEPPPACCSDDDCPDAFAPCVAGRCQFPLGATCDDDACASFCGCQGSPAGHCDASGIVATCACD